MSEFRIEVEYPQAPRKVWRALTDPALIPRWTQTGKGGRPVGFAPVVGTHFQFVAKPMPGWNGVVQCEVQEVREPTLLRYSWIGDEGDDVTMITYRLAPHAEGTRFTWEHTGFTGAFGFMVCKLLERVRRRMLEEGLRAVLAALDASDLDEGAESAGSDALR